MSSGILCLLVQLGTSDFDDFEIENIFGMLQCECERYWGQLLYMRKQKD